MLVAVFGHSGQAQAQGSQLGHGCQVAADPMNFSDYDPSAPYDASAVGTMSIACNSPQVLVISLITNDPCTRRYLRTGFNRLAYNLYQDSGHSIVWGSVNPICGQVLTSAVIVRSQFSIYGLIPRGQNVRAGTYADLVTIQVNF